MVAFPGACWAFSATGAIEGINQIVTGSLVSLSEQELCDCDRTYNSGCGGGLMDYAFKWVIQNHGIDSEDDYPYQAAEKTCLKNKVVLCMPAATWPYLDPSFYFIKQLFVLSPIDIY